MIVIGVFLKIVLWLSVGMGLFGGVIGWNGLFVFCFGLRMIMFLFLVVEVESFVILGDGKDIDWFWVLMDFGVFRSKGDGVFFVWVGVVMWFVKLDMCYIV